MTDFTQIDLVIRAHIAEREREAQTLMRTRRLRAAAKPHRLRAALATKLARLAVHIDREPVRWLGERFGRPGADSILPNTLGGSSSVCR